MKRSNFNYKLISALVLVSIVSLYFAFSNPQSIDDTIGNAEVIVHFIDVGQGDCAVIQAPGGNILIDAGTYKDVDKTEEYINALGIAKFDYAIFTHPHSDHIGGAATLLSNYEFENVILPSAVNTSATFNKMIEAIENENCEVIEGKAGVSFALGELYVDLLAPVFDNYKDLNNTSVVSKITFGEVSFLFTGDAEELSELAMLNRDILALNSTVLKVGHHGSSTSSCEEFIVAVSPEVAVYSCGEGNDYGHPHRETVNRINRVGAESYRTDINGDITILTDGRMYEVKTEK